MIVCIAEKPSVARDIADVLGAKDRRDGYIEGNGYQVPGLSVTSVHSKNRMNIPRTGNHGAWEVCP